MNEQEFQTALREKVEAELGTKVAAAIKQINEQIDQKYADASKGKISKEELENFVRDRVQEVKSEITAAEDKLKAQGIDIAELKEGGNSAKGKSLEETIKGELEAKKDQIKSIYQAGAGNVVIDISGASLKTAGITSIGNTILPMNPAAPNSPYLPGIGTSALDTFGIIYNPNFIWNYVNRGRTNLSTLAWANQVGVEGGSAKVQEGAPKPLIDFTWRVEFKKAEKIAVMTVITEEFDQDLPGFTGVVKTLMQEEVMRKFDDTIYSDVIAIATPYSVPELQGKVSDPNIWDALRAMRAQVKVANYDANLYALNPISAALADMTKDDQKRYNQAPFLGKIPITEANKVAYDFALVGDMSQFHVDIYKEMSLRVGWNNDDFQRNQFSVVCELRYMDYISDNRKKSIVYGNLTQIQNKLRSGS